MAALLTRRVDIQKTGNPLAIIGAMIGAAVVGPLVDSYATPEGVAAILNGIPPRARRASASIASERGQCGSTAPAPAVSPPVSGVTAQQAPPKQPPHTTRYCNVNTFVVTYQHSAGDARYSAIFRRSGLIGWKLVGVDLNG